MIKSIIKKKGQEIWRYFRFQRPLKRKYKKQLKERSNIPLLELSEEEKRNIRNFWDKYSFKVNLRWFQLYKTIQHHRQLKGEDVQIPLEYYIPNDIYYRYIEPNMASAVKARTFNNKNFYDLYFPYVKKPITIARIMNGVYMNKEYQIISKKELIDLCKEYSEIIIKPALYYSGGQGIEFWKHNNEIGTLDKLLDRYNDAIISEVIDQHDVLSNLHRESINTIRLITYTDTLDVKILSSVLRMGVGGTRTDNATSGGIFSGIDQNGHLKNIGFNLSSNIFYNHPDGTPFDDIDIPSFDQCKLLVKKLAPRFINISKICSWDISIGKNGEPVLIEVSLQYGGITFHQFCNGPIFGDNTEDILNTLNPIY